VGLVRSWRAAWRDRYLDVVASIYLYNEHRGYTALDRVLEAVRLRYPDDTLFQAEVAKHRDDEEKHYRMFRRWFERQGRMPLRVGRGAGHIDRFIQWIFHCTIDALDTARIVGSADQFERLCRVIMLTEQRGFAQIKLILASRLIMSDPILRRIFRIIHRDEPDHFLPYQRWLERQDRARVKWNERAADWGIHKQLMLITLPALFLAARRPRLTHWPDEQQG